MEYKYTAFDKDGNKIKNTMKADSPTAVISALRSSGSKPIKITAIPKQKTFEETIKLLLSTQKVTTKELIVFTRQLGTILSAGVLLSDAIETIATDLENQYFAEILRTVLFHIHGGESFSKALRRHPMVFSTYYIAVIGAGEAVGRLGTTIASMASYMEEEERMRQKLLGAIRYPVFLLGFVFLIVSGIVLFLIPKFKSIFEGNGLQLPLLTRIVVNISEFSLHYFLFIGLGVALIIFAIWQALQDFKIRFTVDYMILQLPIIGKVIRKALIGRFCQTLSMLLEGGVGLITSLTLTTKVVENSFLVYTIEEIRHSVTSGSSLNEAMGSHKEMPRILVKMVAVGEKAGVLSDMIKRMGIYYDQEVEIFLNNINSLLEPIFIIVIGVIVLVVALALYMPIFKMSSAVH
jgi:type IV pilus assembly protein PilC